MIFTTDEARKENGGPDAIYVDYKNLPKVMQVGKFIYIDDGTLIFKVIEIGSDFVQVEAQNSGKLSSRKVRLGHVRRIEFFSFRIFNWKPFLSKLNAHSLLLTIFFWGVGGLFSGSQFTQH